MRELSEGLVYLNDLNKMVYSNNYIINSGLNLENVAKNLGYYAEYISEDDRDVLYARSIGIQIFSEEPKDFDHRLIKFIDTDQEIKNLIENNLEYEDLIVEEYNYISNNEHNILLLKMAFILKDHLDKIDLNVFMMRGSGIASFILYLIGLNKVNPNKFGLDYKNFWK